MNNNFNLPDDKLDSLLKLAGKKLGRDPNQLRSELESGKLDGVLGNLDSKTATQMNGLLQNPKALEAMLQNEKIRNLLNGLMGGQK